VIEGFV